MKKKNHVPEVGFEPTIPQITQNQGKLNLNTITTLLSSLMLHERVKLVMWSIITAFSLQKSIFGQRRPIPSHFPTFSHIYQVDSFEKSQLLS